MESSRVSRPHRPVGITVIVVLMWIQGIFGLIAGLVAFFERNDVELRDYWDASSGTITAWAIIAILVGLATIFLAVSLGRGSNVVRIFIGDHRRVQPRRRDLGPVRLCGHGLGQRDLAGDHLRRHPVHPLRQPFEPGVLRRLSRLTRSS